MCLVIQQAVSPLIVLEVSMDACRILRMVSPRANVVASRHSAIVYQQYDNKC